MGCRSASVRVCYQKSFKQGREKERKEGKETMKRIRDMGLTRISTSLPCLLSK